MRKLMKVVPLFLAMGLLTSCGNSNLPFDESSVEDSSIDTPYTDYILPATSIVFPEAETDLTLQKGATHEYVFSMEPKRATPLGVSWTSKDENIATVDSFGVLTAVSGGETTISVTSPQALFNEIILKVKVDSPLIDFSVDEVVNLKYEETYQISPSLNPSDATDREFTYVSDNEEVATVDKTGLVTSKKADGFANITIISTKLGADKAKKIRVNVSTTHVQFVEIDKSVTELEIGNTIDLSASFDPKNAYEQEIGFSLDEASETDGRAVIDFDGTYHLRAVKEGDVIITAYSVGKPEVKDTHTIRLYQVRAHHINVPDINLSNKDNSYQIVPAYVDKDDNSVTPTITNPSYEIVSGGDFIKLSETGLVTFKDKGSASIKVSDPDLSGEKDKIIPVICQIVATSVTISGANSVYTGESIELVISSDPARETLSLGSTISITKETAGDCVSIDESKLQSEGKITVTGIAAGTVTIEANIAGVKSQKHTVKVINKPFETGRVYVVGNKDYSTHISQPGKSWDSSNKALLMVNDVHEELDNSKIAYREQVTFEVGDVWKIRVGDEYKEINVADKGKYDESDKVFKKGQMYFEGPEGSQNVVVATAGTYSIQYAYYDKKPDQSPTDWYEIHVTLDTPSLTLDTFDVHMALHATFNLNASYIDGELKATYADEDIVTVKVTGSTIALYGVAAGETTISVFDDNNAPIIVTVEVSTVEMMDIYFTKPSEGFDSAWFNTVNIHYWGGSYSSDYPGVAMEEAYKNNSGQQVLKAYIPADTTGIKFCGSKIGGDSQVYWDSTVDITSGLTNNKGFYLVTGEWGEREVGSWDVTFYTIVYDANGGTGKMFNDNAVVDTGWGLKNCDYTKEGYIFAGWNTKADGSGDTIYNAALIEANTHTAGEIFTLYAQWVAKGTTLDVFFTRPNSGYDDAWAGKTPRINYWGGEKTTEWPGVNMKEAYVNGSGEQVYVASIPFDTQGIIFNSTKIGEDTQEHIDQTVSITTGMKHNLGYYLTGGEWGKRTVGTWDVTFYTINYDANGGTGEMESDTAVCNVTWGLKDRTFGAPADKIFSHWNTASDGSGTSYYNKASILADTYGSGDVVTLYAQWKDPEPITIYFSYGSSSFDDMSYVYMSVDGGSSFTQLTKTTTPADQAHGQWKLTVYSVTDIATLNCYFTYNFEAKYGHPSKGVDGDPEYWDTTWSVIDISSVTSLELSESYVLTYDGWNHNYGNWEHAWYNYHISKI